MGGTKKSRVSGATTPEKQEHILIGLAYELAERQLRDGTASPMIVSQLLKRGTLREELELEKLRRENAVLESKKTVLDSNTNTERLMTYISQRYQGRIEYLWERSPDSGAIRHLETLKWYGVFMTIDWKKLDAGKSGKIEVLNVKTNQASDLTHEKGIYPAFHMNKKYWVSIPLDNTLADEELFALVDSSWQLTKKGK